MPGAQGLQQGFPVIVAPFVDDTRQIEQVWLQLLISLWNRTGQGPGGDINDALALGAQALEAPQIVDSNNVLGVVSAPSPVPTGEALMALLFAQAPSQTSTSSGNSTAGTAAALTTEILADNPTAFWKCTDASGNITDSGPGNFTLTTVTSVTYQETNFFPGDDVSVLRFNGASGVAKRLTTLGLTPPLSGDWTVEAMYYSGASLTSTIGLFSMDGGTAGNLTTDNTQVQLNIIANRPEVIWQSGNRSNSTTSASTFSASIGSGAVYHLMAVKDSVAKTVTFYVNGVQQGAAVSYSNEATGGTGGNMTTYIGTAAGTGVTNNLGVGFVAFYYGQKLSKTRVRAHARAAGHCSVN